MSDGFNPLRWDCKTQGCFNIKHRPKIEIFAEDLPGKIAISDIDGTVEVNGHFLFMEWKSGESREIPLGQKIWAQRLTKISNKLTYVIIFGNCETMEITAVQPIGLGAVFDVEPCSLKGLKSRLRAWVRNAGVFSE